MDDRAGPPPDLATRPGVSLRDTTEFDRLANFSDAIYAISQPIVGNNRDRCCVENLCTRK